MEAALAKRYEARRTWKGNRTPSATWSILRAACKGVKAAIEAGIDAHFERFVAELETVYKDRDMRGLYKQLKRSVGLDGRKSEGAVVRNG